MVSSPSLELRPPKDRPTAALPERYRARVLAALPGQVERIVLFGSRALGEAHADSDWDFAVFLDHEPTAADQRRISDVGSSIWQAFDSEVQSHVFAPQKWLATDELACNIRDQGLIIYGPDHVPKIERPVLEHAGAALAKAERYAEQAAQAPPQAYETVVHNSYYAMFHAARAALLAVEGNASTNHSRVHAAFAAMIRRRRLGRTAGALARTLAQAYKLRIEADYGSKDLTRAGQRLRQRVLPFLDLCRGLLGQGSDRA
jgi:uncharacterized protein (UPF0332 family)/predicted nucleotidyltransferase